MKRVLATALVTLAACAQAPDPTDGGTGGGGGGKADGSATRITFSDDFSQRASGPIVAGQTIEIAYDLDRNGDCRGETGGSEVWGTTAYAKIDDGAPRELAVSRLANGHVVPVTAELRLPSTASHLELWFANSNKWGCIAYDSNEGANYAFDVKAAHSGAVLAFDADWSESQSASLHTGDSVVVHYATERLEQCAGSSGGHAAWGITGYYQVDGGTVHQLAVARADGSDLVAADPSFSVPRGGDLAMWFEATSVWGCHAYDSDLGGNYHFTIE